MTSCTRLHTIWKPLLVTGALASLTVLLACGSVLLACGSEGARGVDGDVGSGQPSTTEGGIPPVDSATGNGCSANGGAPTCEPPIEVATAAEILAVIDSIAIASDITPRPDSGAKLRPSRDVRVTAFVELDAMALRERKPACPSVDAGSFPGGCFDWKLSPERPTKLSQGGHVGTRFPPGVECITLDPAGFQACERVTIQPDTVVRFQRVHERSPVQLIDWYYLRVVRACGTACATNEVRCAASETCITVGESFCLMCEGNPTNECACRDDCKAKPDGLACTYDLSDDQLQSGTCAAGKCR